MSIKDTLSYFLQQRGTNPAIRAALLAALLVNPSLSVPPEMLRSVGINPRTAVKAPASKATAGISKTAKPPKVHVIPGLRPGQER